VLDSGIIGIGPSRFLAGYDRGRIKPRSHYVRRRTSTQGTADAKLYATYRCCQWTQLDLCGMLRLCVSAAVQINVLDYNGAVRSVNGV